MTSAVPSQLPKTQLAAIASKQQPLSIEERPLPQPEDKEILVKITATAINPVDWKMKDDPANYPFLSEWPAILGSDAAGIVAATGKDVTNLKVGDRVFFQGIITKYTTCTFQQYSIVEAVLASKTPSNISDEEASGISLAAMTPNVGLYHPENAGIEAPWSNSNAGKGKAIIILGGSSSVGQYGIQFARLSGFSKIVTSSSLKHKEFLEKIGGANLVVLDRNQAKPKDFLDATQGFKIETIFDSISDDETQKLGIEIYQGQKENSSPKLITVLGSSDDIQSLADNSSPKIAINHVLAIGALPQNRQVSEPLMKNLHKWLENKEFFPNRVEVVKGGLRGLDEALEKNKKGVSGVKIVVKPSETS